MSIMVENYRKSGSEATEDFSTAEKIKKRKELCEKLGLTQQSNLASDLDPKLFYPEVEGFELMVWREFLPKTYVHSKGEWGEYRFDVIPNEVIEEIDNAKQLGIFTDFLIRTSERLDPIALGVVGIPGSSARYFMIARWGEALKSFEEIAKEVISSKINTRGKIIPLNIQKNIELCVRNHNDTLVFQNKSIFQRHCGKPMFKFHSSHTFHIGKYVYFCQNCNEIKYKEYYISYDW